MEDLGLFPAVGSEIAQIFTYIANEICVSTGALGIFIAAAAGIVGVIALVNYLEHAYDRVKEKADNARENYETNKQQLEQVTSELETIQQRMDELNASEGLTFVEQQELNNLEQANQKLLAQKKILEQMNGITQKQAAKEASNVLTAKTFEGESLFDPDNPLFNTTDSFFVKEQIDILDKWKLTNDQIVSKSQQRIGLEEQITKNQAEQAALQEQINSYTDEQKRSSVYKQDVKDLKSLQKEELSLSNQSKVLSNEIQSLENTLPEMSTDIELYAKSLYDEEGNVISGFEDVASKYEDLYLNQSFTADMEAEKLQQSYDNIINSTKNFQDQYNELIKKAKEKSEEGGITQEDVEAYQDLVSAMVSNGFSIDDIINNVNSTAGIKDKNVLKSQLEAELEDQISEIELNPDADIEVDGDFDIDFDIDRIKENAEKIKDIYEGLTSDSQVAVKDFIRNNKDWMSWDYKDIESNIQNIISGIEEASEEAQESVEDIVSGYETGFSKIQSIVKAQSTGKSVSADDYVSDDLRDYTSALEYHNGVLQYNAQKVNEIAKAKSDEAKQTIKANKAMEQSKYLENAKQIQKLRESLTTASDAEKTSIQSNISNLLAQNAQILTTCNQYDLMTNSINEATSAYQNWLNAQGAAQSGDMFDSSLSALQKIKDTLANTSSNDYGRVGNTDYKAALDFIIPDSIDKKDEGTITSYIDSIRGYLTYNDNGVADGLNLKEFCDQSVKAGLMAIEEGSDEYKIAGQKTMQDFADGLGLALPFVQAIFGEMEEFGGEFDWADELPMTFSDLAVKANEASESLRQIDGNSDLKIVLDVTDFESKEAAIATLDDTIQQMNDIKASPEIDTSQIEEANSIIEYCVALKQKLNAPDVMSVNTSQVTGAYGNALSLLQQFQSASNTIEMQASIGVDTSEAEASLASLASEIQALPTDIKQNLEIDDSSISSIESSIENLSAEQIVSVGVDSSLVDAYTSEEHQGTGMVIWDNNTDIVDGFANTEQTGHGTVRWGNDTSAVQTEFTAQGTVIWTNTEAPTSTTVTVSASASANGTAHATGTAYAKGNWGTAYGGKTLVGELGTEIIVNPITGRWYTVGNNGAEFVDVPKNAIVFNHLQSESLLNNGYAIGRASSLVSGSAMVTGGIKLRDDTGISNTTYNNSNTGGSSSSDYSSYGGYDSSYNGGNDGDSSQSSSEEESKPKDFDWIEIKIERIERKIKALKNTADYVYKSWTDRNGALAKEMSEVTNEIGIQKKAYDRYIQQANSVGLSAELAESVRNGKIDIREYDDDTKELIDKYKEWYEKALDCKDAIDELNSSLTELYEQQFENIITKWDNALQNLGHSADRTESIISRRSAYASDYVVSDASRKASKSNINDYQKLIYNASNQASSREEEVRELRKKLSDGVSSGAIKKGSDGYYSLLKEIQDTENEIDKLKSSIIDYSNSISAEYKKIFDSLDNDYKNKLSLAEHLSNEYSNYLDLAQAKGYKTSVYYYTSLRQIEEQNAKDAAKTAKTLQMQLNKSVASGEIKTGSNAWYEMKNRINEVEEAIQKAKIAIQEYSNEIRKIRWNRFDYIQEKIGEIAEESTFLVDLLSNNKMFENTGMITSDGMTTIGLHGMNYNVYMNEADRYASEIKSINKLIAKEPYDSELIDRKLELIKVQRESIKESENEKQAIKSLVSDGIKEELSYIKELINNYKDALDSEKDLYDYQKKVKTQTSEIAKLQKQLSAYTNDISEETKAKIQKIQVDLNEKREELRDTEYDKMISDSKKMLDDFYDEYEMALNTRLDNIDELISNVIQAINNNAIDIDKTITDLSTANGFTLSESIKDIWANTIKGDPVLTEYKPNDYTAALSTINRSIENIATSATQLWKEANEQAIVDTTTSSSLESVDIKSKKSGTSTKEVASIAATSKSIAEEEAKKDLKAEKAAQAADLQSLQQGDGKVQVGDKVKFNKGVYYNKSSGGKTGKNNIGKEVYITKIDKSAKYPYHISTKSQYGKGDLGWLKKSQISGYASGSKRVGETGYAWTQEGEAETYLRASDHAVLTRVGTDDRIYNAMASENLWQAANNPSNFIANNLENLLFSNKSAFPNRENVNQYFDNINFVMPNVKNYNELITQMQNDNKFEKLVQSMTLGRLNGKTSNSKYHISFN